MTRVGVIGAGGRMGREVCLAVSSDPDLELVAAVDPRFEGAEASEIAGTGATPLKITSDIEELKVSRAEVAVDFTSAAVAVSSMRWCVRNGVHAVVGTTGIGREDMSELEEEFSSSSANCVIAANFAIGAVLMMRFAEMAALYMQGAEIIELHHDGKLDAPSGTALTSAGRMAESRLAEGLEPWPEDRTEREVIGGSRGAKGPGGVRVHAVRLPGLVAHQEVILGAVGQSLTIRHDAYDRTSFMPGVLLAVKAVPDLDGVTIGLDSILGF